MPEMKTLNGYEVVDAKARHDIEDIMGANLASEEYVDEAIAAIPKPDYTGLATEAYVDNAIDNIPEVDLSKHALKSELPTKVSQLQNDSKFITREEVPETDLSAYAKKTELPTKNSQLVNDSNFITLAEVPKTDLSDYAKKSEIPDVSDFITSIPSEYITESELNAKGYLTQHQSLAGYATETFVTTKIAEAQLSGEEVDLSGYATKDDIKDFITEVPSEYVTESELNAKGYLTEHQSLDGKADKVHSHPEYLTEHQSLADYATKTFVTDTVAENQPDLTPYAKKSELFSGSYNDLTDKPTIPSTDGLATEDYVNDAIANIEIPEGDGSGTPLYQHTVKAEFTEYASGQRKNPHIYVTFIDSRSKAYTLATFVANLYNKQKPLAVSGNVYMQHTSSDGNIYPIDYIEPASETSFKFSYRTSSTAVPNLVEVASTETCTFLDTVVRVGTAAGGEEVDLSEYALKSEIPDVSNFITEVPEEYVTETELNAKGYLTEHQSLDGYATEKYVDDAIANIGGTGGGSGSSAKTVTFIGWDLDTFDSNNNDASELAYLFNYYKEHSVCPPDRVYYVKNTAAVSDRAKLVTGVECADFDYECSMTLYTAMDVDNQTDSLISCSLQKGADGKASAQVTFYQVTDRGLTINVSWYYTSDTYDVSLYNASEVYVIVCKDDDTSKIAYSHFLSNTSENAWVLGESTHVEIPFVSVDNTPELQNLYWWYDGSSIQLNTGTVRVRCIRYKN